MTSTKKIYTKDDLIVRHIADFKRENGITSHTHTIEFGRPLNEAEQQLFHSMLTGFYYVVRFSPQLGGEFVAEPTIEFVTPQKAYYTFRQTSLSGEWKDLLLGILANFSYKIAPITLHDKNPLFDPAQAPVATTA